MSINHVTGIKSDLTDILDRIREVSSKSKVFSQEAKSINESGHFNEVMSAVKNSVSSVSHMQQETESLKNAYISGDKSVSMAQVVVSAEKSKLAFEGLVVVRNKLLEAYKEIMNMPV